MEDVKLSKLNLFWLKVDFSSAFSSIDHTRLLSVMERLGMRMPNDAVRVVDNLYTWTTTGQCGTVKVMRGTIQGDSVSPFLFLLFIEPLLRWLNVGGATGRHAAPPSAAASAAWAAGSAAASAASVSAASCTSLAPLLEAQARYGSMPAAVQLILNAL